jgi:hypothetical protein
MSSPPSDDETPPGFLPKTGNYQTLLTYRKAEIIYDFTFRFCDRSGKQNIAEGCKPLSLSPKPS